MKPIIIRRADCGHWNIFISIEFDDVIVFDNIAHVTEFSDVLLVLNGEGEIVYNAN